MYWIIKSFFYFHNLQKIPCCTLTISEIYLKLYATFFFIAIMSRGIPHLSSEHFLLKPCVSYYVFERNSFNLLFKIQAIVFFIIKQSIHKWLRKSFFPVGIESFFQRNKISGDCFLTFIYRF